MARTTRFQTVPLKTNGSSYSSRSIPISSQRSLNLYPEITMDGISDSVMHSWPNVSIFATDYVGSPSSKGMYFWNNKLYIAGDNKLKEYSQDGTVVEVGPLVISADRVKFSNNSDVMLICAGGSPYSYDGAALTQLTSITFNPTFPSFLNERFYLNGDDGAISVSDVISTNFDSANIFYGRSDTDETTSQYVFNQIIYLISKGSIEPWQDVGAGAPPVSRIDQGIIEGICVLSPYGITNTSDYMYFIGSDGHAYRLSAFSAEDISNTVISNHFYGLDLTAVDANYLAFAGHKFIIFDFYNDSETWVFSETSGAWFELASLGSAISGDTPEQPYAYFNFVVGWDQVTYGITKDSGYIYYLDQNATQGAGGPLPRERTISCVSGDDFGEAGQLLEMSSIAFSVETGVGTQFLGLESPVMEISPSFDGGYTFGRSEFIQLGRDGNYTLPTEYYNMKVFRRAVFRLRVTDIVSQFTLYSASIKIRMAVH